MAKRKDRLDRLLVQRGLVPSRSRGAALVMAGEVLVDGRVESKAGAQVSIESKIEVVAPMPYVSRGGFKLAGALEAFNIDVSGRVCADVGACTGGFTDVLLQKGADKVYAIDVGYGQLAWKLRQNPRVVVLERTNARYLDHLPEPIEFVSVDVSFISLSIILKAALSWIAAEADIVALIKPQFEAGPENVGKGGIVRDPKIHREVLRNVLAETQAMGLAAEKLVLSPLRGADGNAEFLGWFRVNGGSALDIEQVINQVVKEAWSVGD